MALPEDWHGGWFPTHHKPPHVQKEHRENVRETLVEFPSLHFHCGAQPHRQRFALRCTSRVSHGAGGHQGLAWSTPQSRAHVSPMFSMQHHPVMQRAVAPCTKSADSPHTPAASPQGRHRDLAPLHWTRVHLPCHLPIPAISLITPSAKNLAQTFRDIGCVCRFASPVSQSPGTVLQAKGTSCSTPSPAVLASHDLALCSVTVPHSDTASRLLLVLPHTARRTRDTSRVPLPGCFLRTRLRPRTPPPHLEAVGWGPPCWPLKTLKMQQSTKIRLQP